MSQPLAHVRTALRLARQELDEVADMIRALDDPGTMPASLALRLAHRREVVDELVKREADLLS